MAVASVSLLLVTSAVEYVFAPVSESLGATLAAVASKPHHCYIGGKVQGKHVRGLHVRVMGHGRGHMVLVDDVRVGKSGRFHIPVRPGAYEVVLTHGSHRMTMKVTVTSTQSEFIVVKVTETRDGLGLIPVIFNY